VDRQSHGLVAAALGSDLGIKPGDIGVTTREEIIPALRSDLPCFLKLIRNREPEEGEETLLNRLSQKTSEQCLEDFGVQVPVNLENPVISDKKKFKRFLVLNYIKGVSLNNVSITVDGILSVEVLAIQPRVEAVTFDPVADCGGPNAECFWSSAIGGGVRTGKITGTYLSGGTPVILEDDLKIDGLKAVAEGSSDNVLRFTFKLTKGIPTGRSINFKVTKPKPGSTEKLESPAFTLATAFFPGTPTLAGVELKEGKVTVNGAGFLDAPPPNTLSVKLMAPDKTVQTITPTSVANDKIVFDMPKNPAAGCWRVMVQAGVRDAIELHDGRFAVLPSPALAKATIDGDKIVVEGENLIDTSNCPGGKPVRFRAIKEGEKAIDLVPKSAIEPKKGEFKLPDKVDDKWTVEVLVGDVPVDDKTRGQKKLTKK